MKKKISSAPERPSRMATGIDGFDELTYGGLTPDRTTLLQGGPGTGKTVFALQTLVNAARLRGEAGIFVAFEETASQIVANAACFDWNLPALLRKQLFILEARLSPQVVQSGSFDLGGMLAILKAKKEELNASWIVFDGIDVLLTLLRDPAAEVHEIYRIRDWLAENPMNAIITAKCDGSSSGIAHYGFMQFMTDCVIRLDRHLEQGISLHRLQITKHRGAEFIAGEHPVSFGPAGLEVAAPEPPEIRHAASTERISAGFDRLDTMLGGGVFRGSSTLITGVPGTSKTTLAAKFAEAACKRGERTLFVSFDEGAEPIMRNLASVGIELRRYVESGLLFMYSARTESTGAEDHLAKLKTLMRKHEPRNLVIDPLSAIAKAGGLAAARAVANRLIYMVKDQGVTVMVTAISDGDDPQSEATELEISTVADTWIHLSYVVCGGERNRALTIIKSRGTCHSNQVRELVLSAAGPELSDVYAVEGNVLMGTLRWQKEKEDRLRKQQDRSDADRKLRELQQAGAETRAQIKTLELDLQRQMAEIALHSREDLADSLASSRAESELRQRRSADPDRSANGGARPAAKGRSAKNVVSHAG